MLNHHFDYLNGKLLPFLIYLRITNPGQLAGGQLAGRQLAGGQLAGGTIGR